MPQAGHFDFSLHAARCARIARATLADDAARTTARAARALFLTQNFYRDDCTSATRPIDITPALSSQLARASRAGHSLPYYKISAWKAEPPAVAAIAPRLRLMAIAIFDGRAQDIVSRRQPPPLSRRAQADATKSHFEARGAIGRCSRVLMDAFRQHLPISR